MSDSTANFTASLYYGSNSGQGNQNTKVLPVSINPWTGFTSDYCIASINDGTAIIDTAYVSTSTTPWTYYAYTLGSSSDSKGQMYFTFNYNIINPNSCLVYACLLSASGSLIVDSSGTSGYGAAGSGQCLIIPGKQDSGTNFNFWGGLWPAIPATDNNTYAGDTSTFSDSTSLWSYIKSGASSANYTVYVPPGLNPLMNTTTSSYNSAYGGPGAGYNNTTNTETSNAFAIGGLCGSQYEDYTYNSTSSSTQQDQYTSCYNVVTSGNQSSSNSSFAAATFNVNTSSTSTSTYQTAYTSVLMPDTTTTNSTNQMGFSSNNPTMSSYPAATIMFMVFDAGNTNLAVPAPPYTTV